MSEHPVPWKIQIVGKSGHVIDAERNAVSGFDPDDADFWSRIVKAVNNHDALIGALRSLLDDKATTYGVRVARARAALARAGDGG